MRSRCKCAQESGAGKEGEEEEGRRSSNRCDRWPKKGRRKRFGFVFFSRAFSPPFSAHRCTSFASQGSSHVRCQRGRGQKLQKRGAKGERQRRRIENTVAALAPPPPERYHLTFGPPAAGPAGCCDSASGSRAPRDRHVASRAAAEASSSSSSEGGGLLPTPPPLLLRPPPTPPPPRPPPTPPPGLIVVRGCRYASADV